MKKMRRKLAAMIGSGKKQKNLWNMNSPNLSISNPGFNSATRQISADGVFSIVNSSGVVSSRIEVALTASELGLEDGKEYTVVVYADESNDLRVNTGTYRSTINVNNSNTNYSGPSPISNTWTQDSGYPVKIGTLYFEDYSNGSVASFWVMLVEGDHIDGWVPFAP